jgi:hypothetical protein
MEDFNKTFDKISVKYDNVILIGDLNYNVLDEDKGFSIFKVYFGKYRFDCPAFKVDRRL